MGERIVTLLRYWLEQSAHRRILNCFTSVQVSIISDTLPNKDNQHRLSSKHSMTNVWLLLIRVLLSIDRLKCHMPQGEMEGERGVESGVTTGRERGVQERRKQCDYRSLKKTIIAACNYRCLIHCDNSLGAGGVYAVENICEMQNK